MCTAVVVTGDYWCGYSQHHRERERERETHRESVCVCVTVQLSVLFVFESLLAVYYSYSSGEGYKQPRQERVRVVIRSVCSTQLHGGFPFYWRRKMSEKQTNRR